MKTIQYVRHGSVCLFPAGQADSSLLVVPGAHRKVVDSIRVIELRIPIGTAVYVKGQDLAGHRCLADAVRAIGNEKKLKCPGCGNGICGVDELCEAHYAEYLGTHRGSRGEDYVG